MKTKINNIQNTLKELRSGAILFQKELDKALLQLDEISKELSPQQEQKSVVINAPREHPKMNRAEEPEQKKETKSPNQSYPISVVGLGTQKL